MTYHELMKRSWYFRFQPKAKDLKLKLVCTLCFAFCILLLIGCGEQENKNLANARELVLQGKYKESAELESELNLALKADSKAPEALSPLKALEIVKSGTSEAARGKAVADITSLLRSVETKIKELEAIDKDFLTDDDKDNLKKLNRQWNLSLEPTAIILTSETGWVSDVGRPAIDLLIELLKAPNPATQRNVVEVLVLLKDQTFQVLIEALGDDSDVVRRQAVIALGKIGDERAVEPIAARLDDEDPGIRFYVPVALDMIGGEKIIEPLHRALENEVAKVRTAAVNILGKMEDETGIDLLVNLLADNDSYVTTSTINALTKIGKPAVPSLVTVLNTSAKNVSLPATNFVGDKISGEYKKVLAKQAALQVSAASILGDINDTRAVEPLLEAMRRQAGVDPTADEKANAASVRAGAAAALGAMGPAAVEPLIKILLSPAEDEKTRVNAVSILGVIADKRAIEPLISALKDEKKSVRASAAAALGTLRIDVGSTLVQRNKAAKIGRDRRAVPSLIELLKDPDVVTRANAATSLGRITDERAVLPLMDVVTNVTEREKIRSVAITSLGTLKSALALETLVKILINEYEKDGIRKDAAAALRVMENIHATEPLIGLLKGEIVIGILMPEKGAVKKWRKKEGDKIEGSGPGGLLVDSEQDDASTMDRFKLVDVPTEEGKTETRGSPQSGTLIKIYVQEGESVEAGTLIGLVSYKDRDIDQDERSSIRSAAASALGKMAGPGVVPALKRSLRKDKSAAVRKNAAMSLRERDNIDARSVLVRALKGDNSGIVRSQIAYALGAGAIKNADSVAPLINSLRNDKYDSTRDLAAWSLGELLNEQAVKPLTDVIVIGRKGKPESSVVVNRAIVALDTLAGRSNDAMLAVLENTDIDAVPRSKAARVLGLIESVEAVDPLITALKDESVVVRSEAVTALGIIASLRAVKPLIGVIEDENEWVTVRANAVTALQRLRHEDSVMPLIGVLGSEITAIRNNAVVALGPIKDKRAAMPLIGVLENEAEDDAIRASAAASLGSIGDLRAVGALITALDSDSITIRQNAAVALGNLETGDAVKPLMGILSDVNQPITLRANAAAALGKIGDKSVASLLRERMGDNNEFDAVWNQVAIASGTLQVNQIPAWVSERAYDVWEAAAVRNAAFRAMAASEGDFSKLLEMLNDATVAIRAGAAIVLGDTGRKEAVQPLMDKMYGDKKDVEEVVRRDSAKGLALLADPSSEQALIEAHKADLASVKIQSGLALGNIKGEAGISALIETLGSNKERNVRANAAVALGNTGSGDPRVENALREAIKGDIAVIHFEAAEALRKLTGEDVGYQR